MCEFIDDICWLIEYTNEDIFLQNKTKESDKTEMFIEDIKFIKRWKFSHKTECVVQAGLINDDEYVFILRHPDNKYEIITPGLILKLLMKHNHIQVRK